MIWSSHLHEDRPSRAQKWGHLSIETRSPLAWREYFLFPCKTKDWRLHLPGWDETWKISLQSREADQHNAKQTGTKWDRLDRGAAEHSHVAREGPGPRTVSQLCCFHSHAVPQLSYFMLDKVSMFTAHQIGDSCWFWIGTKHHHRHNFTTFSAISYWGFFLKHCLIKSSQLKKWRNT